MKSTQLPEIGTRLREFRIKLHLTQTQMADHLEMSLNYYGLIERGQRGLSTDKIILCRNKLGIDLNYLFTGILPLESEYNEYFKNFSNEKRPHFERLLKELYELCK